MDFGCPKIKMMLLSYSPKLYYSVTFANKIILMTDFEFFNRLLFGFWFLSSSCLQGIYQKTGSWVSKLIFKDCISTMVYDTGKFSCSKFNQADLECTGKAVKPWVLRYQKGI